jgi:NAD+ diphosphatase
MDEQTVFLQGDALIRPLDNSDSPDKVSLSAELSSFFTNPEIFTIPSNLPVTSKKDPSLIHVVSVLPDDPLPDNWRATPVRQLFGMFYNSGSIYLANVLRAHHIAQWRRESRFCGTCGAENENIAKQAQRICPKCGRIEFPRICPAIIVLITDKDNRILLARNIRFRSGVYSHISGFNEAGETLEETVKREILEEINIKVCNIEYIKSQPWPFPNSLMVGFKARYLSGTIQPDGEEIIDAKWFTPDNLPELPAEGSLSRFLINGWLDDSL